MLQIENEVDPFNFPLRICIFPTYTYFAQAKFTTFKKKNPNLTCVLDLVPHNFFSHKRERAGDKRKLTLSERIVARPKFKIHILYSFSRF